MMHRLGLLADDSELFRAVFDEFRQVHWDRYATVMSQLHQHSARAYLAGVRVPTLVTAGGRDRMTPPHLAEEIHRCIVGSELRLFAEGTHYTPIELGEQLGECVADFLARVDRRRAGAQASAPLHLD
jgi:pimeloyl-ACP methyl ester carboxylesterase